MDSSDHNQSCAICLESLLPDDTASSPPPPFCSQAKIGAVVPCGHVFHRSCWNRWCSAHKKRNAGRNDSKKLKCKCPMCNAECDNFVQLFLGEKASGKSSTAHGSFATEEDSESIMLLAKTCHDSAKRLDRVKEKLNRYKKENRTLETKLKEERRHMEETVLRTTDRQSKERRTWKRQQVRLQEELKAEKEAGAALQQEMEQKKEEQDRERRKWKKHFKKLEQKLVEELNSSVAQQAEHFREWGEQRTALQSQFEKSQQENESMKQEIDRTIELQVEERRMREQQMRELQQELDQAREDRANADSKVQKAIQGIAQMRVYHEIRKDQTEILAREKALLQEELRMMKEAAEATEEVLFD